MNAPVAPNRKHAMIKWQEEQLKRKTWVVERRPRLSEEEHEEECSKKEVHDGIGKNVVDAEFVDQKSNDDDHDDDQDHDHDDSDAALDVDLEFETRSTLPLLIREFQEWLASPDGSKKDGFQLFIMLKANDDSRNFHSSFDLKLIR